MNKVCKAQSTPLIQTRRKFLLAIPLAAFTASCTHRGGIYGPPPRPKAVYVAKGPPPMRVEQRPRRPVPHAIWIGGYWSWTGVQYIWVSGLWDRQPRGAKWIPGRWNSRRRGWVWAPGQWR